MSLSSLAAVVLGGTLLVDGGAGDPSTPRTAIYLGATLIDGKTAGGRSGVALVTRGERIVAVVDAADAGVAGPGAEVVDVSGKFIVPGLVNSHVHLATEGDAVSARAYLRRELYSGVTAVRDMAGDARLLAELQREASAGEIVAPDVFYAAVMAGPGFFADPRTHSSTVGLVAGEAPFMRAVTSRTNLPLAVAEARGTGATGVKLYAELPASLVRAITAEAHRQHMEVWAHAYLHPAKPSEVVAAGVDVVSHACLLGFELSPGRPPLGGESGRVPTERAMQPGAGLSRLFDEMRRRGSILDATLSIYDRFDDPATRRCAPGVADHIVRAAHQAGVSISVGTDDDPDWRDPDSTLDVELEYLVRRAGMTPREALEAATVVGARTLGRERDLGTLEPGKLASFVVLGANPLEDISNIRRVEVVVKRGVRHPRSEYAPLTGPPRQ